MTMKFYFIREKYLIAIIFISAFYINFQIHAQNIKKTFTLSGYVKDSRNGEALINSIVYIKEIKSGAYTNNYGFYSISLPSGKYHVRYTYIGYQTDSMTVDLTENKTINKELGESLTELKTITVQGERADENITKPEMSLVKLETKTIKQIPALMGEVDVIKVIQMLPGVQSTSEGTSGFSVRGGGLDQNLILLDEATVYNASHLMGFFSVFNNDAIKDVTLYKGDIPASFGSRLSSVLDVRMKEGNNKNYDVTGGIGLISSRLTVEGPIVNEKTSFLISARRTYADIFFPLSTDSNLRKSKMYFYDMNLKVNHQFDNRNRLYFSAYAGRDVFEQGKTASMGFGNQTGTLRWNHLFSDKLFFNLSTIFAKYNYSLYMTQGGAKYYWKSTMLDYSVKADFNYFINPQNELRFGLISTYHDFDPCNAWIQGANSNDLTLPYPKKYALEHGIYISNQQTVNEKLTLKYGIRFSLFQNIGKGEVYRFNSNYSETGKDEYARGKIFCTQDGFEPRFGANYTLNKVSAVKASFSRTLQFMQLASNSTGGMPLDIWFPASPNVKPQRANQYAIGYFRNFKDNAFETSIEAYYKQMYNVIDFKDHAQLLMNPRMEGEIRTGKARSYGIELFVKKNQGKLNGWISYTYSRVLRSIADINKGSSYPAPYDKPNNVNVVLTYELNKKTRFSANWIYATGAPVTFPVGTFTYDNTVNKIYSSRNGYRMRDYHRLDLSLTVKGKERPGRLWHGEWVFSIYNLYGRHNDWMINFTQDNKNPNETIAERWYLPFVFFPGITYNFNFNFKKHN